LEGAHRRGQLASESQPASPPVYEHCRARPRP
jgi:hypothetical protein